MLQSHFDISMLSFLWKYCEKNVLLICNRTLHLALDGTWHWDFNINQKKKKAAKEVHFLIIYCITYYFSNNESFFEYYDVIIEVGAVSNLGKPERLYNRSITSQLKLSPPFIQRMIACFLYYIILSNVQLNIWMYISIPACAQIICHLNLLD